MARHLILGGARSGKSAFAIRLAQEANTPVCFIATACASDEEMEDRIARHRRERPISWQIVEEPIHLGSRLRAETHEGRCVIVDCLALWLSNSMLQAGADRSANAALELFPLWENERDSFIEQLSISEGELILVSNEVGLDVVPAHALVRRFRDELGRLNQRVAAICERVTLLVAGLSLPLKVDDATLSAGLHRR